MSEGKTEDKLEIVAGGPDQAPPVTDLIRAAITHLCEADHAGQADNIRNWLTDRTEEKVEALMLVPGSVCWLAMVSGEIAGVSLVTSSGKLELCYVHPTCVGRGIGKRLLRQAEQTARENGLDALRLISTTTAKAFYELHGYRQYTDQILQFGMPGYPMLRTLMDID